MYGNPSRDRSGATPRITNPTRLIPHSRPRYGSVDPRDPRTEPLPHPARYLFGIEREALVVTPVSVDVEEPRSQALVPEAQLLHDPQRRGILRPDVDLDAVEVHGLEAVVG